MIKLLEEASISYTSHSPQFSLLRPAAVTNGSSSEEAPLANFNRLQTPPLGAQSGGAPMNSPYSRMYDQLEHFVDVEQSC